MDYENENLHFAAEDGNLNKVIELLEAGYDINAFDEDLAHTPLHRAARAGDVGIVKFLISAGAEVNIRDENNIGETPLGEVASNCSYETAAALINAGADPTIQGWMGITALERASERKRPEGIRVYELLLKAAKQKFGYKA